MGLRPTDPPLPPPIGFGNHILRHEWGQIVEQARESLHWKEAYKVIEGELKNSDLELTRAQNKITELRQENSRILEIKKEDVIQDMMSLDVLEWSDANKIVMDHGMWKLQQARTGLLAEEVAWMKKFVWALAFSTGFLLVACVYLLAELHGKLFWLVPR